MIKPSLAKPDLCQTILPRPVPKKRQSHETIILVFCVLGLIALIVLFFNPGYMNTDTMDMWGQANHFIGYWDWHSVLMAALWSEMRHIYPGPQSMLVFQDLLFCIGVCLLVRSTGGRWEPAALLSVVVLYPPVFAYLGTIGKDSLLGCSSVLTVGLVHSYRESHNAYVLGLALVSGFIAYCARQNAVFALIPILFLLFWERLAKCRFRILISTAILFVSIVSFALVDTAVKRAVHARISYPYQVIPIYDLAALSSETDTVLLPSDFISPAGSLASIKRSTSTRYINTLIWPWGVSNPLKFAYNGATIHALLRVWVRNIVAHPILYVRWRCRVFAALADVGRQVRTPYIDGVVPNPAGVELHDTRFTRAERRLLRAIGNSLLFRVYVYLIVLVVLVAWAFWKHDVMLAVSATSGLTFFLAYFVIGVNSEFRMACYTMFIAVVMAARYGRDYCIGWIEIGGAAVSSFLPTISSRRGRSEMDVHTSNTAETQPRQYRVRN